MTLDGLGSKLVLEIQVLKKGFEIKGFDFFGVMEDNLLANDSIWVKNNMNFPFDEFP